MFEPLKKYAVFSGRARRSEYWLFMLFVFLVSLVATIADDMLATQDVLVIIASIVFLLPTLAVSVRRLHDTDRSGWWVLIVLVPFIGGIVLFVFCVLSGTEGDNRFGPDPKAGEVAPAA